MALCHALTLSEVKTEVLNEFLPLSEGSVASIDHSQATVQMSRTRIISYSGNFAKVSIAAKPCCSFLRLSTPPRLHRIEIPTDRIG
jgi:hypothetical protein